jgi:hypothetical protein
MIIIKVMMMMITIIIIIIIIMLIVTKILHVCIQWFSSFSISKYKTHNEEQISTLWVTAEGNKPDPITQVCSGKIVFKISTFLYRFLFAELKKIIKFYHVPFFFTKQIFRLKIYLFLFVRIGPLILHWKLVSSGFIRLDSVLVTSSPLS